MQFNNNGNVSLAHWTMYAAIAIHFVLIINIFSLSENVTWNVSTSWRIHRRDVTF